MEVHDAEQKPQTAKVVLSVGEELEEAASELVSHTLAIVRHSANDIPQTIKGSQDTSSEFLMPPPSHSPGRTGERQTVKRGDLDQAIRSMKDGKRRARPNRPLSRIFLDGRPSSHVYD